MVMPGMSFTEKLREGTKEWGKLMEAPLKHRNTMLGLWASGYFDSNARSGSPHPMNLFDRAIGIMLPYLVMTNPKVSVGTRHLELRHQAYTTELATNNLLAEIKFAQNTLRPAVLNSLFGWGITKTAIMKSHEVEIMGFTHDVGQTYSDVVDDSDFVGDPAARTIEEMQYLGNSYLMRTDYAKEFFGKKHADSITPGHKLLGESTPDEISKGEPVGFLRDHTRFTDYWLPDEGVVITILTEGEYKKILRTVDYDGPEGGPYDILGYKWFPQHPIPIPPAWNWLEMDALLNEIVNKMKKQAGRQKTIMAYESGSAGDMERLAAKADGGTCRVDNIGGIKPIDMGGINPDLYNWISYLDNQFSVQGQNLYTLGGRSSQAGTLGQEQMLFGNASKGLDDMVGAVYAFAKSIITKHVSYMWGNPLEDRAVVKNIEGLGEVQANFNPVDNVGDFVQYSLNLIPYSMQVMSPEMEYQRMLSFMSQWILPTAQIATQQGNSLDVAAATKELARKFGLEDIDHWFKSTEPQNVGMNAYQPKVGSKNPGQQDGRAGLQGTASRQANLAQQQQGKDTE